MKWGRQALLCDRNPLFLPMKLQNIYLALSYMMPKPLKANRRLHQSRMGVNSRMEKHGATTRVRWEKFGKRQSVVVKLPSDRGSISQHELIWQRLNSYYIWDPFCLIRGANNTTERDCKHADYDDTEDKVVKWMHSSHTEYASSLCVTTKTILHV